MKNGIVQQTIILWFTMGKNKENKKNPNEQLLMVLCQRSNGTVRLLHVFTCLFGFKLLTQKCFNHIYTSILLVKNCIFYLYSALMTIEQLGFTSQLGAHTLTQCRAVSSWFYDFGQSRPEIEPRSPAFQPHVLPTNAPQRPIVCYE